MNRSESSDIITCDNMNPIVTIVVPVYNRAAEVQRTLDSIATQTYRPFKVVLVDNNSTDASKAVLDRWADENSSDLLDVSVITEVYPGAAAARNAGLDMVETPWVMFFDSDDTMAPDHLQRIHDAIRANEVDMVGWDLKITFLDGSEAIKPFKTNHMLYNCIQHATLSTQRYICKADMVRAVGGWNRSVSTWDDIELGSRLLSRFPGIRAVKISGVAPVQVYESVSSITGPSFHSRAKESEYALNQISNVLASQQQYMVNLKRIILAANYAREGFKDDALRLRSQALSLTSNLWHRLLLKAAYTYTATWHRGAATLLRSLF